ncbi:peptide MFS transporter [Methylococcus sp. EFPC2]|uniref:peptide MFS transporter n=1 Tax=Methylococcus sp. EFPC2 TaxID=2812648 RepID=UPI001967F972|nr:peptide MFS transporter [Methylococcus sp. EFPC2]QSA97000.1 peptide MFS transporter [Methylococcus sp. EFPC2]
MERKTLLGHPPGLFVLFFTEMWERFSFYGMRSLLVLYMTQHLIAAAQSGSSPVIGFEGLKNVLEALFGPLAVQPLASQIYGLYTGFVYFTPLFGGLLADRLLGPRNTVVLGAVLMALGHFLMAFEAGFLLALLLLILGNGCFKPNISTQVGGLYPPGDPRRDGAYTVFYMGINLGSFFSPLVCGTLGQIYGWHYGFAAAGVGMLAGLFIYLAGQKYLRVEGESGGPKPASDTQPLSGADWKAVGGLIVLAVLNIVFWAVYEQQGNTLQLFADSDVDRHIFGWEMPSTWFQSLNPAFILLFAPVLAGLSRFLAGHGRDPGSIGKMALGSALLGASFLILIAALAGTGGGNKMALGWLVLCTLVYTLGELYLSPIGLSLVSKLAPARLLGLLMGMWFLSSFFGNYLSGYIGSFYERMPRESFFLLLAALGIGMGLAIFALKSPLKKAVGDA